MDEAEATLGIVKDDEGRGWGEMIEGSCSAPIEVCSVQSCFRRTRRNECSRTVGCLSATSGNSNFRSFLLSRAH